MLKLRAQGTTSWDRDPLCYVVEGMTEWTCVVFGGAYWQIMRASGDPYGSFTSPDDALQQLAAAA